MELQNQFSVKCLILGDGAVGKTSCVHRWIQNKFQNRYASTVGVEILNKSITTKNNKTFSINFWDIAGQVHFKTLRTQFYSGAIAALLIFDVTNQRSFESVDNWILEATSLIGGPAPIILLANKIDLDHLRVINDKQILEKKNKYSNIIASFETSALNGKGINDAFNTLAEYIGRYFVK